MDSREQEEILYRLDERTKRVDEKLNDLDERVAENSVTIENHDERISENEDNLNTAWHVIRGIGAGLLAIFSGAGAKLAGLLHI